MVTIIDTNHDTTHALDALKSQGVRSVGRYISTNTGGDKVVKPEEARAIAAKGLRLFLVFEVWGGAESFEHDDINAASGTRHGAFARDWAARVGAPAGACIYFAIDTDVTNAQIANLVVPYFAAAKSALRGSGYRIGVYGAGVTCKALLDRGLVDLTWVSLSTGWTGSREFIASGKYNLHQLREAAVAGLDADTNEANPANPDFGDFTPFGGVGPEPTHPMTLAELQGALSLTVGPITTVDELNKTVVAVRNFQKTHDLAVDGIAGPNTTTKLRETT